MSAPMAVAAAKALCAQYASTCNVDEEDAWKIHGSAFLQDAEAALMACGALDLLGVLKEAVDSPVVTEGDGWWKRVFAAVAKAEASTKTSQPDPVFDEDDDPWLSGDDLMGSSG